MVTGTSDTIAVFVPSVLNPFFGRVMHGVTDTAVPTGYNVFLCYTESREQVERQIEAVIGLNVDGVIFFDMAITGSQVLQLSRAGIPCVLVDNEFDISGAPCIRTDNAGGGRIATDFLLDLGHRRIAHIHGALEPPIVHSGTPESPIPGPEASVSFEGLFQRRIWQERLQGYLEALGARSLTPDPALIVQGDGTTEGGVQGGCEAMKTLLQRGERPSAVYAGNDLMAIGVLQACRDEGLDVPRDVSVIGFDDIDMSTLVTPPLTTIRQQRHKLGTKATELLLRSLGREVEMEEVSIQPELVIRSSTAPPSPAVSP
ncbi:MAG: LacI family transcriptional regulator [Spirochaetaceae bacterium]|nr:MAG: LacI family transcriptional regulator [Spirochaetaceae bacterium]